MEPTLTKVEYDPTQNKIAYDRETRARIEAIISYGELDVVYHQWTRAAYQDLTSMGREFIEPAKEMSGFRSMKKAELAEAIHATITFQPVTSDVHINALLGNGTWCAEHSFRNNGARCWLCVRCKEYTTTIKTILPQNLSFQMRS